MTVPDFDSINVLRRSAIYREPAIELPKMQVIVTLQRRSNVTREIKAWLTVKKLKLWRQIMSTQDQREPQNNLNMVYEKIHEIMTELSDGDYIYRGNPNTMKKYPQPSTVNTRKILRRNTLI